MRETETVTAEREKRNSETPKNREKEGKDKGSPRPTENVWPFLPPPRFISLTPLSLLTTHSLLITNIFPLCGYFFSTWPSQNPYLQFSALCTSPIKYLWLQGLSPYYLLDWACLTHIQRPCSILQHLPPPSNPTTSSTFRFFLFINILNYFKYKKKSNIKSCFFFLVRAVTLGFNYVLIQTLYFLNNVIFLC